MIKYEAVFGDMDKKILEKWENIDNQIRDEFIKSIIVAFVDSRNQFRFGKKAEKIYTLLRHFKRCPCCLRAKELYEFNEDQQLCESCINSKLGSNT